MTRTKDSIPTEEFEVVNVMPTDCVRDIRSLAEHVLAMCNRMDSSTTSASAVRGIEVEERQTMEQAIQTECVEPTEAATTGFERHDMAYETLKLKLKEVVGMNVGWQRLHEQQTKRIAEMAEQIAQLQQTIASSLASAAVVASEATHVPESFADACSANVDAFDDSNVESLKRKCSQLESEKLELEARVCSLQTQLDSTHDIVKQLEQAVDQLNSNLDSVAKEKQSFIDMLQAQVLVYREDFECERHDREMAQSKLVELKAELEYLRQKLNNEERIEHRTRTEAPRLARYVTGLQPLAAHSIYANPGNYEMVGTSYGVHRPDVAHKGTTSGRDEVDCDSALETDETADQSDSSTEVVTGHASDNVENRNTASPRNRGGFEVDSAPAEDILRCPNCLRHFTIDQHVDLMNHMEICEL